MSGWNHRVFRNVGMVGKQDWFDIRETYYAESMPDGCTSEAIAPGGETLAELANELGRMLAACSKPVLAVVDDKIVEWKP